MTYEPTEALEAYRKQDSTALWNVVNRKAQTRRGSTVDSTGLPGAVVLNLTNAPNFNIVPHAVL